MVVVKRYVQPDEQKNDAPFARIQIRNGSYVIQSHVGLHYCVYTIVDTISVEFMVMVVIF